MPTCLELRVEILDFHIRYLEIKLIMPKGRQKNYSLTTLYRTMKTAILKDYQGKIEEILWNYLRFFQYNKCTNSLDKMAILTLLFVIEAISLSVLGAPISLQAIYAAADNIPEIVRPRMSRFC